MSTAWAAAFLLAAPVTAAAAARGAQRANLRSRDEPTRLLCRFPKQQGFEKAVDIFASAADNTRTMQFEGDGTGRGDDGFIQTMVRCEGSEPGDCSPPKNASAGSLLQRGVAGADCMQTTCSCQADVNATYGNYQRHMSSYVLPACREASGAGSQGYRVLLIGLGGGALPTHILANCPAGTSVETIEYDPRVAEAASRFFGLRLQPGVNDIFVDEGGAAVAKRASEGRSYDAVLIDAWTGPFDVPESCRSESFIGNVRRILKPGGLALQNIDMGQFERTLPIYSHEFGADSASAEMLLGNGEMAIGRLIVGEQAWYGKGGLFPGSGRP